MRDFGITAMYLVTFCVFWYGMVAAFIHSTWLFISCLFVPPVAIVVGLLALFGLI